MVRLKGLEPLTNRLKVYCSTTELQPQIFPRSVHTPFQGIGVVFGLLIYIAVGGLTRHSGLGFFP